MDKITHQIRLTQWTSIIKECRSSGMTIRAWCSKNKVNEKQFYYWQRRVRKEAFNELQECSTDRSERFVPLPVPIQTKTIPENITPDIVLRHEQYTLEISNSVSPALLDLVLKAVSHAK